VSHEVPLFPFIQSLCFLGHFPVILLVLVFAQMFWLVFRPGRIGLIVWLLLLSVVVVADQNRLVPWLIQYVIMFFVLSCEEREADTLIRLVLGGIYMHSGLHKFNSTFADLIMPQLLSPLFSLVGLSDLPFLSFLAGHVAPVAEFAMGVLMVMKNRNAQIV
jgi:hypothetical protein